MSQQDIAEILQALALHKQRVDYIEKQLNEMLVNGKGCRVRCEDDLKGVRQALADEIKQLDARFDRYVALERFKPVEILSYGLVSGVLMAVLGAVLTLVIKG